MKVGIYLVAVLGLIACKRQATSTPQALENLERGDRGQKACLVQEAPATEAARALVAGNEKLAARIATLGANEVSLLTLARVKVIPESKVRAACETVYRSYPGSRSHKPERRPWTDIPGCFEVNLKDAPGSRATQIVDETRIYVARDITTSDLARVLGFFYSDVLYRIGLAGSGPKTEAVWVEEEPKEFREVKHQLAIRFLWDIAERKGDFSAIQSFLELSTAIDGQAVLADKASSKDPFVRLLKQSRNEASITALGVFEDSVFAEAKQNDLCDGAGGEYPQTMAYYRQNLAKFFNATGSLVAKRVAEPNGLALVDEGYGENPYPYNWDYNLTSNMWGITTESFGTAAKSSAPWDARLGGVGMGVAGLAVSGLSGFAETGVNAVANAGRFVGNTWSQMSPW